MPLPLGFSADANPHQRTPESENLGCNTSPHGTPSQEVPPYWHSLMENIGCMNATMERMEQH